jgi:hypothetical protein
MLKSMGREELTGPTDLSDDGVALLFHLDGRRAEDVPVCSGAASWDIEGAGLLVRSEAKKGSGARLALKRSKCSRGAKLVGFGGCDGG